MVAASSSNRGVSDITYKDLKITLFVQKHPSQQENKKIWPKNRQTNKTESNGLHLLRLKKCGVCYLRATLFASSRRSHRSVCELSSTTIGCDIGLVHTRTVHLFRVHGNNVLDVLFVFVTHHRPNSLGLSYCDDNTNYTCPLLFQFTHAGRSLFILPSTPSQM